MEIYYKENTGIKNPQDRNLDYFKITLIGSNFETDKTNAEVIFYEFLEDAQQDKTPPAARVCEWNPDSDSTSQMRAELFALAEVSTTAGETITLNNPTPQNG